jgi:hypothetical protein
MRRHRLLRRLRLIILALMLLGTLTAPSWVDTAKAQNGVGSGPPRFPMVVCYGVQR